MSTIDELWRALEPHIDWAQHLALIFLYADHPDGVEELRRRCEALLASKQQTVWTMVPQRANELTSTVMQLATPVPPEVGAVWLELWRGAGSAAWDDAVADQLARLNAGRGAIERDVRRPFVLVLPTAWWGKVSVVAPDLWTIRSFNAVMPAPPAVARGIVEAPAVRPVELFTIGPPSFAEKEWARLYATGQFERIDPWIGFQAVEAAMRRGSLTSARQIAEQVLHLTEIRLSRASEDPRAQRDLWVSLNKLGDVEVGAGNLSAARGHYERALAVREGLAKADPHSAEAQRDLSVSLERLGDVELGAGNLSAARGHYERALEIDEGLAKADPHSAQAQRDLSVSLNNLGDVELGAGNLSAARGHYERALGIDEGLAKADPHSAQAQRDLSVSHDKLGRLEVAAGNMAAARQHLEHSLRINEAQSVADPHNMQASFDVIDVSLELAKLEQQLGNQSAFADLIRAAATRLRELEANHAVDGFHRREAVRDQIKALESELP